VHSAVFLDDDLDAEPHGLEFLMPCRIFCGKPVSIFPENALGLLSQGSEARMVPFFVQIKCQLGKSYEVANRLADAEIASEIYSTAGDFDLLVKFYIEPGTDIGHFIAEKVQTIPGIQDTRTIITFKAFGVA
jgi:DNA-binding Lrp family transcriptional regulator